MQDDRTHITQVCIGNLICRKSRQETNVKGKAKRKNQETEGRYLLTAWH